MTSLRTGFAVNPFTNLYDYRLGALPVGDLSDNLITPSSRLENSRFNADFMWMIGSAWLEEWSISQAEVRQQQTLSNIRGTFSVDSRVEAGLCSAPN